MDLILPFKKGDFAESKSFIDGYKCAWFRCKINDMRVTETGSFQYLLEYLDYPDEEKTWTEVFEKNPAYGKRNSNVVRERECMLRPSYPELYWGDQVPEQFPKSNVIVSVCDTPKVGDLVEWLSEGSYWTAKVTKLLSEDMVKVQLLKPPIGEGGSYTAYCKDIRPALDWCLEKGWTVPLSQANGRCWHAARLIHHKSDTEMSGSDEESTSDDDEEEAQKSLKRASNSSQEAPGSNLEITSDTTSSSRINSQTATIATTKGISRSSPETGSVTRPYKE
uniref:Agenet domain-containing protein n=1 Tax=Oryza rufipogon TaxID=4529 RepID=A0A0E0PHA0_ORYRU